MRPRFETRDPGDLDAWWRRWDVVTLTCEGRKRSGRHRTWDVQTFRRDRDGWWVPVHSGQRDGQRYWHKGDGLHAASDKVQVRCSHPKCAVNFQRDREEVYEVFNILHGAVGNFRLPLARLTQILDERRRQAKQREANGRRLRGESLP